MSSQVRWTDADHRDHPLEPPAKPLSQYPFPLRAGLQVWLRLPDDLTAAEADRLAKFVRALAQEEGR